MAVLCYLLMLFIECPRIERYYMRGFWRDHCRMYRGRPIYWLFASRRGSFRALVYMHRMNPYTADRVCRKYLQPYMERLREEAVSLEKRRGELEGGEPRRLAGLRVMLEDCREYEGRLRRVADQAIAIDLDDGVAVNHARFGDVLAAIR